MADDAERPEPDRIPGCPHPSASAQLIGQETAERLFLDAWAEERLHHAWLLRGPEGVGKATLAYRMARAIIADGPPGDTGGGLFGVLPGGPAVPETLDTPPDCPVAARIRAGSEPALSVLRLGVSESTGKLRSQIVVEDARALKGFLQLSAADGGWRAVIVDSADQLNRSAANALLKMLEEPPERVLMMLISHAPGGLLPTIRSRCRTLDLGALSPGDLARAMQAAGAEVADNQLGPVAELAAGSVGRAMRLIQTGGIGLYADLTSMLAGGRVDRGAMVALADRVAGREGAALFPLVIDLTQTLLARCARAAATGAVPNAASPTEPQVIARLASHPAQATAWAEASARATARFRQAVAVNLDPGQTIMDTFLDLDTLLGAPPHAA